MFKKTTKINLRRKQRLALLVRPDDSKANLLQFQRDGYTQAVFVKNPICDVDCDQRNGEIYDIEELLKLDNPKFRVSHPNCLCAFKPYGKKKNEIQPNVPKPIYIKPKKVPPTTIVNSPPQPKKVQL